MGIPIVLCLVNLFLLIGFTAWAAKSSGKRPFGGLSMSTNEDYRKPSKFVLLQRFQGATRQAQEQNVLIVWERQSTDGVTNASWLTLNGIVICSIDALDVKARLKAAAAISYTALEIAVDKTAAQVMQMIKTA
jgi:hypothetical protein